MDTFAMVNPKEAIAVHQRIQSSRGENYEQEVSVSGRFESPEGSVTVQGRIDGVLTSGEGLLIEEIKTVRRPLEELGDGNERHWAQAKVYGHFLTQAREIASLTLQLTYYQVQSGETLELRRIFEGEELKRFFEDLARYFVRRRQAEAEWVRARSRSMRDLAFPFEDYRTGQRDLAIHVYRAIRDTEQLLVQAPTGVGKTVGVLFPALKELGENEEGTLLYLTARTTGQVAVNHTLRKLRASGARLRSTQITAKEKVCFNPDRQCNGEECSYARGYYDRADGALEELGREEFADRETLERIAHKHHVCPFELSLEFAQVSDVILGDYNYAFDPGAFLRKLFESEREKVLIVDEAHNLVDRGRDIFSADLTLAELKEARKHALGFDPLRMRLEKVIFWLETRHRQCSQEGGFLSLEESPEDLFLLLRMARDELERSLHAQLILDDTSRELLLEFNRRIHRFLHTAQLYDKSYRTVYRDEAELTVKLLCLEPGPFLRERFNQTKSTVFLSATLSPGSFYRETFGCVEDARKITLPSPFPREHLLVISAEVSTLFRRRQATLERLVHYLESFLNQRSGRFLVFFPSYSYLSQALSRLHRPMGQRFLIQTPEMTEVEREDFLGQFHAGSDEHLVGFGVLGGIFAESIDLVGERLTGVAIVGVGLPGLSPERNLIRDYFSTPGRRRGFEYAYQFPGMNRVLQAAGRVIRSRKDRGVVLLLDERFRQPSYQRLLPPYWQREHAGDPLQMEELLSRFWQEKGA